jgi:arginine/lysine/ornithine decarboxylase
LEEHAKELFDVYYDRLQSFYSSTHTLKNLRLMDRSVIGSAGVYAVDPSKLILQVRNDALTGPELFRKLRTQYHIIMELEAREYVLGMTSLCDTEEGFDRLSRALLKIDGEIKGKVINSSSPLSEEQKVIQAILPYEAMELPTDEIPISDSRSRIASTFISIYPPGIPISVPGEIIEDSVLECIERARQDGLTITGLSGTDRDRIRVIRRG